MNTRFINCETCQTEGRILTNNGGPDDVDHGVCPACNGDRVVEVETEPVSFEDREREAREECARRGLDPDDDAADAVSVWMVVEKEIRDRRAAVTRPHHSPIEK